MKMKMKLGLLMATVIGFATLPALAENNGVDSMKGSGHEQGGGRGPGQDGGQEREQKFEEVKAKILQHLKEGEACVGAAKDFKDLRSCKPKHEGHKGGGMMGGGMGGGGGMHGDKHGGSGESEGNPDSDHGGGPDRDGGPEGSND